MSFRWPSHVSATTGSDQIASAQPAADGHRFRAKSMTASRTTPTELVLVMRTGPSSRPDSSSHAMPVISPLPLRLNAPAKHASRPLFPRPRGSTAVTPVRMRSPSTRVTWPTSTPGTSVIASKRPGVPNSNGMPRSRARGEALSCAAAVAAPRARELARWRAHIVTGPPVRDYHWLRLDWSDVVEERRAPRSGGVLPLAYGGGRGAHLHERDPLRGNGGEPRRAAGQ